MKNILFLPLIWFVVGCSSSASESIYFINKIAEYNHRVPVEPYPMDDKLRDKELLIFNYKKYKEFSLELDNYLRVTDSTHLEQYRYISHSKILLGLSEDINKSKALKNEFKYKVLNDFSNAIEVYFSKYKIKPIDSMACKAFADNIPILIEKYFKSTNIVQRNRIDDAIEKYESCKKIEWSFDKKRDDTVTLDEKCTNLISKTCKDKTLEEDKNTTTENIMGVQHDK